MSSPSAANDRCSCLFSGDDDDHDEQINNRSCPHCRRSNSALLSSYSSSSLLSFDSIPVEDYDKRWRIVQASIKGFTIGAGIKGGLALFSLLARFRRRRSLSSAKKVEMASSSEDLTLAVKETLRYGLFLGAFAGTYVSVDELIAAIGGHHRTARWRALLAGAIAGPSMLLTGLNTEHTSLAIYILMRAAVLASRCGIKSERFGRICKPLTWAHGDIFLMCLGSSQILPYTILGKGLLGTARSSLFLSVYCSSAWLWTCFCFRLFKRCNIPMVAIGTFPTGIALAIEKKSRRIEISLYCLARAIESFFTCMADLGYLPPQSKNLIRADVVVFSISTAIIMHCYAIERDVFRSKYLNVLDWVFGVPLSATEATLRKSVYKT